MASNINIKYILIKTLKKKKAVEEKNIITETDFEKETNNIESKQQSFLFKNSTEIANVKKNIFEIPSIKLLEKNNHQKI